MPRILTQKECRCQGSKTGIMNVGDVAQHIKRDPVYLVLWRSAKRVVGRVSWTTGTNWLRTFRRILQALESVSVEGRARRRKRSGRESGRRRHRRNRGTKTVKLLHTSPMTARRSRRGRRQRRTRKRKRR